MPNKNYLAGRRFEYETVKHYRGIGYTAMRTAGSHGEFDVIVYAGLTKPLFIQCKRTESETTAKALEAEFRGRGASKYFHQMLRIKIKGSNDIREVVI